MTGTILLSKICKQLTMKVPATEKVPPIAGMAILRFIAAFHLGSWAEAGISSDVDTRGEYLGSA